MANKKIEIAISNAFSIKVTTSSVGSDPHGMAELPDGGSTPHGSATHQEDGSNPHGSMTSPLDMLTGNVTDAIQIFSVGHGMVSLPLPETHQIRSISVGRDDNGDLLVTLIEDE